MEVKTKVQGIKDMLFGVSILLTTIIIHQMIEAPLATDFIAIVGIILVCVGSFQRRIRKILIK